MDVRATTKIYVRLNRGGSTIESYEDEITEHLWLEGVTHIGGVATDGKLVYIRFATGDEREKIQGSESEVHEKEISTVSQGKLYTRENLVFAFNNAAFHFYVRLKESEFERLSSYIFGTEINVENARCNFTVWFEGENKNSQSIALGDVDFSSERKAWIVGWALSRRFKDAKPPEDFLEYYLTS